jgi:hypothetical protein
LKATVHGLALGLAAVMGAYNLAAWMKRRQSHLAVNAFIYLAAVAFEQRHVRHHLFPCVAGATEAPQPEVVPSAAEEPPLSETSRAA